MNFTSICICILLILLVGVVEPERSRRGAFRKIRRRVREKTGRVQPTREFLGFANDGSSFRNPLSSGGGFRAGRSIIWKTSELPSSRGK